MLSSIHGSLPSCWNQKDLKIFTPTSDAFETWAVTFFHLKNCAEFWKNFWISEKTLPWMYGWLDRHNFAEQFPKTRVQNSSFYKLSVSEKLLEICRSKSRIPEKSYTKTSRKRKSVQGNYCFDINARTFGCLNCSDCICWGFKVLDIFAYQGKILSK